MQSVYWTVTFWDQEGDQNGGVYDWDETEDDLLGIVAQVVKEVGGHGGREITFETSEGRIARRACAHCPNVEVSDIRGPKRVWVSQIDYDGLTPEQATVLAGRLIQAAKEARA